MEGEEPPPPSLKLLMLQGPRKGEALEFQPGSAIRIGRVVRGNTLPIKDPGISTKHLSILTESGKWVLRDLDSSNGTVLDDTNIPPNTPFHLRDGSTIKIGEVTSILVAFLQPQQNPTRTGSTTVVEPGHETEVLAAPVAKPVRGRRGKGLKGIDENASVNGGDESGYVDRPAPKRVTRNSKNTRSAIAVSDSTGANLDAPEEKVEEPKKNTRATRNSKNTRATRNSKNKRGVTEICDSSIGISDALEEKVEEEPKKNTRVTRNSKNKGSVIGESSSLEGGVENVEKKKTRGGAKGKRKLQELCAGDGDDGKENSDEREKKENLNGDGDWPDLENMSLGEWFDFLEVHLPKQIIDATEEMFDSMRQKAERLREYIMMQENNKVEVPVE